MWPFTLAFGLISSTFLMTMDFTMQERWFKL